ncbi:flagellar motor switch phosphatase FliY [Bacillus methanolicus]|uniref:flagellar motor switch phosphatase FliY n=1 Tax=Bacillus methanolicus TaxID=1471 RepID=UPI0023802ACB|nr:flagellar motor switch phosphatase FliY [Bacillus methanolicus]MDE3838527.1 flagellar motor switch phosphatase FliY [Bacillus methanolicus]
MMSDNMLSQDEIDALLRGTDNDGTDYPAAPRLHVEDYLSLMEKDALGEIGNISFGSSATALSTLLNQKVEITTPEVSVVHRKQLPEEFPHPYVAILVNYTEGFSGSNLLVIKQSDAAIIADLMLGGDGLNPSELMDEIQMSAVQEAMNQMMGSAATSMSTIFNKKVDISPPSIDILDFLNEEGTERIPNDDLLVKVSFRLKIGELIDSNIMQLLPLEFAKSLVKGLLNPEEQSINASEKMEKTASAADRQGPIEQHAEDPRQHNTSGHYNNNQQAGHAQSYESHSSNNGQQMNENLQQKQHAYSSPFQERGIGYPSEPGHFGTGFQAAGNQPNVQPAVFSSFEPYQLQESESKNLNILLDIPLQITVELGRTRRSVKEILDISAGSIIELDKLAGEPVDILVNNRLIAKGEVVVIDENFGVRVTDIISQSDRINKLR